MPTVSLHKGKTPYDILLSQVRNTLILLFFVTISTQAFAEPQKITIPEKLRLKEEFLKDKYYGVIQSREEFKKIWAQLYDANSKLSFVAKINDTAVPDIDFEKYSVIWYAPAGAGVSFVKSLDVIDEPQRTTVKVAVVRSDFMSYQLNLWQVPKIHNETVFEETKQSDGGI